MLQSFWDYLRYAACDAILAGVEDAVRLLEQDRSPNDNVAPSSHLSERLKKAAQRRISDTPSQRPTAQPSSQTKSSQAGPQGPATSNAPSNHRPADQANVVASPADGQAQDVVGDGNENRPVPSLTDTAAGHLRPARQTTSSVRQPHRGRPKENAGR